MPLVYNVEMVVAMPQRPFDETALRIDDYRAAEYYALDEVGGSSDLSEVLDNIKADSSAIWTLKSDPDKFFYFEVNHKGKSYSIFISEGVVEIYTKGGHFTKKKDMGDLTFLGKLYDSFPKKPIKILQIKVGNEREDVAILKPGQKGNDLKQAGATYRIIDGTDFDETKSVTLPQDIKSQLMELL